jgi:hypothetical protein
MGYSPLPGIYSISGILLTGTITAEENGQVAALTESLHTLTITFGVNGSADRRRQREKTLS